VLPTSCDSFFTEFFGGAKAPLFLSKYLKYEIDMSTSTWVKTNLKNKNFLAPNGFKLTLDIFPEVSFFSQSANIPGISIPSIEIPTPYRDYPVAGTETIYEDLSIKFLVDEDIVNYTTLHKLIRKTGLATGPDSQNAPITGKGLLEVLNSNFKPHFSIEFDNIFPISLTPLEFNSEVQELEYFSAQAVFKYTIYRIKDINGQVIS